MSLTKNTVFETDKRKLKGNIKMQIVILAGGEGSRLRPLTSDMPKPMVRVLGTAVIERLTALLFKCGFREATVADFYMADKLEHELGSFSNGIKLSYVREDVPLGTAGCVRKAWNGNDDVMVVSGDSVCDFDFESICRFHQKVSAHVTIVTHHVADPREYGLVTADQNGRVVGFLEKPGYDSCLTDVANTGTYVISQEVIRRIPKDEKIDFAKDIFPMLLADDMRIFCYPEDGVWHDIGDIPSLLKCQSELLSIEGRSSLILSGAQVNGDAIIGGGSVIEADTCIGADCRIQGSLIMSGTSIGEGTSIKHSIVADNVTIGRGCRLMEFSAIGSGCVIGSAVTVDAGVRIENGTRIPSGTHLHMDVSKDGYRQLSFGDYGEAVGIKLDTMSLCRFGMAVADSLELSEITLGIEQGRQEIGESIALGLRSGGTLVYSLNGAGFGETVFAARKLGTRYCIYIGSSVRLIRSDRIELARSEERKVEQRYNRGEMSGNCSAPVISAEAASALYAKELTNRFSGVSNVRLTLKTDSFSTAEAFTECTKNIESVSGERIQFTISSDQMSVLALTENARIPYENLILLACRAHFDSGKNVRLPQKAPMACDDYAKRDGLSVTRVFATDDLELSPFSYDPLMLIADVMSYVSKRCISLSAANAELPEIIYTRRTVDVGDNLVKLLGKDFSDMRKGRDIVVETEGAKAYVRPLRSGKSLAMYVESVSTEAASSICDDIIKKLGVRSRRRQSKT